jgi:hypothetical protein
MIESVCKSVIFLGIIKLIVVAHICYFFRLGLVFWCLTTFNNIAVISMRSVLLVEETEVPGESHQLAASH